MKFLHILRSEPDGLVRRFVKEMSSGGNGKEVPLYLGSVDYDRLLDEVFQSDMVICWW